MSDIENSIQAWRESLLAREGMRAEHADELEDHLREEIAHMNSAALSESEMFRIAVGRLGRPDALARELRRADSSAVWRKRWIWMLVGYLALTFASRTIGIVQTLSEWMFRSRSPMAVFSASCATFVLGALLWMFVARIVSRTRPRPFESARASAFARLRSIAMVALIAFALELLAQTGWWFVHMSLPWAPTDSRMPLFTTYTWTFGVFAAFVPVAALCVFLWRKLRQERSADPEQVDAQDIWTVRWIWMLTGYLGLTLAGRLINDAQALAQWFSRTQTQLVAQVATVGTYFLGALVVVLLARRMIRRSATLEAPFLSRKLATPGGIVSLALVGLVVEWMVLYGSWLGYNQLKWEPGDTRMVLSGSAGWTYFSAVAALPVAALCWLIWLDRQPAHRSERIEA